MTGFVCEQCGAEYKSKAGRTKHQNKGHEPYHYKSVLEKLYVKDGMSTNDIADEFDVDQNQISRFLKRQGIKIRTESEAMRLINGLNTPTIYTNKSGYEIAACGMTDSAVKIHRLVAYAHHGNDIANNHVHHENKIPWDNRPQNLDVVNPSNHTRLHNAENNSGAKAGEKHHNAKLTKSEVVKMRKMRESGMTYDELANEFGVSPSHAWNVVNNKRWKNV